MVQNDFWKQFTQQRTQVSANKTFYLYSYVNIFNVWDSHRVWVCISSPCRTLMLSFTGVGIAQPLSNRIEKQRLSPPPLLVPFATATLPASGGTACQALQTQAAPKGLERDLLLRKLRERGLAKVTKATKVVRVAARVKGPRSPKPKRRSRSLEQHHARIIDLVSSSFSFQMIFWLPPHMFVSYIGIIPYKFARKQVADTFVNPGSIFICMCMYVYIYIISRSICYCLGQWVI